VWVVPPHNAETWPGCLDEAQAEHAAWCAALREVVWVRSTKKLFLPTNDSWIRDFGPLFVFDADRKLVVQDFRFNGWGDKYEPRPHDDEIASAIGETLGLAVVRHHQVLEGGAIDTDGRGTLLTTADCLLHPTRTGSDGQAVTRETMEALLEEHLGITRTVWLAAPPEGELFNDDTDGHVDNLARFITPDTVAVHPALDPTPLHEASLNVLTLPRPAPVFYDYPATDTEPAERRPLPASYANFLIANGRVFVPTFGQAADDEALRRLDEAMPDHTPVPIRANHLLVGLGGPHCLSMQQPAVPV
ncbi:MAG: agmatine deiminase family protein, partial [Planctomycetota bacterium]